MVVSLLLGLTLVITSFADCKLFGSTKLHLSLNYLITSASVCILNEPLGAVNWVNEIVMVLFLKLPVTTKRD